MMLMPEEYDARLNHYNKWLMDPKREFGTAYPGFPEAEEVKASKKAKAAATARSAEPEVKRKKRAVVTSVKPVRRSRSGPTKMNRAREMFLANPKMSRTELVELFMVELNMSKATAATYHYVLRK